MNILERIQGHEDLVRLSQVEQAQLCDELRQFLVSNVAQTGGHLASNLGVVELTVALHRVFHAPQDGHLPYHFGLSYPQSPHRKTVFCFIFPPLHSALAA